MNHSNRPPRKAVVQHKARLDILCCLDSDEPSPVEKVSDRTGMEQRQAKHHIRILEAFGLVGKKRMGDSGPVLYVLRLDQQPDWITEAVNGHRPGGV